MAPANRNELLLIALAVLAIALMAATAAVRLSAIGESASFAPGTAATSGCEEESLLAVWRAVEREPVYVDSSRIPYIAAYFNWLFYDAYGAVLRPWLATSDGAPLPWTGRLLTFAGAIAGALITAWLLVQVTASGSSGVRWVAVALGTAVFLGPLAGWWSFTVRPDIWALAFEAAGCAVFLSYVRRHAMAAAAAAALLFFAAWSFKQTFVAGPAAAGICLLWRRDWRSAATLVTTFGGLCLVAFFNLGPAYRTALTETARSADYLPSVALENAFGAAAKLFPLLLAIPAVLQAWRRRTPGAGPLDFAGDTLLFGSAGLLVSVALGLPAAAKFGAASNYFLSSSLMLTLVAVAAVALVGTARTAIPVTVALVLLSAAPLSGRFGTLTLHPQAEELSRSWQAWKSQPSPRFSADLRLNLPWLTEGSPPFVLAYSYHWDRDHGRSFESDGIGGLIEAGYFASLLLPSGTGSTYDHGSLARYERTSELEGLAIYRRIGSTQGGLATKSHEKSQKNTNAVFAETH